MGKVISVDFGRNKVEEGSNPDSEGSLARDLNVRDIGEVASARTIESLIYDWRKRLSSLDVYGAMSSGPVMSWCAEGLQSLEDRVAPIRKALEVLDTVNALSGVRFTANRLAQYRFYMDYSFEDLVADIDLLDEVAINRKPVQAYSLAIAILSHEKAKELERKTPNLDE